MIIFEPFEDHMYCKEIEKQLIARIHRIGRVKEVTVYRLITKNTIE
jgi:SNF2 family DNA or RNA helicase